MKFEMRLATAAAALAAVGPANAFWRMSCGIIQVGRVDPVVSPGSIANHVHKVAGASSFGVSSTYDSLSQSDCTSCSIQADKSAYWTPALYYLHANGSYQEVPNSGMTVYYLGRGANPSGNKTATPFPKGLKMLAGSSTARSQDLTTRTWGNSSYPSRLVSEAVSMVCIDYDGESGGQFVNMTNMNCPQGFRAQIQMQTCWDGQNLYLPNQGHVAHLSQIDNGICPPTHPVLLPHLFYEVFYSVNSFVGGDGEFVFANGDATGFGFHGDFINGWDIPTLSQAIDQCLIGNPSGSVTSCSVFAASNVNNPSQICPERSPIFPCEPVKGLIKSLPGCITPKGYGPSATAAEITCPGGNSAACNATDTLQPTAWAGDANYSPLGCYTEATNGRALSGSSTNSATNMTARACEAACSGYKYFGVEYGQECYCGNTLNAGSTSVNASQCGMTCSGDRWEICGDRGLLNVFQINSTLWKAPAVPAPYAGDSSYQPLGCYTEASSGRALSGKSYSDNKNMTALSCEAYCGPTFAYFGVEYGQECYCGDTLNVGSTNVSSSDCSKPCSGNGMELCGGGSRLNIFKRTFTPPPPPKPAPYAGDSLFSPLGCYTEASSGRALSGKSYSDNKNMTALSCENYCGTKFAYFGVEYGQECYCGDTLNAGSTNVSASDCSKPCTGNNMELCGAGSRLNVFKRIGGPVATSSTSSSAAPKTTSSTTTSTSSKTSTSSSASATSTSFSTKYVETLSFGNSSIGVWKHQGCYTEATSTRALSSSELYGTPKTLNMTLEACGQYCFVKGYNMSGVEYGQECYCGNVLNAGSVFAANQDDCSTKCPGNSTQFCGAGSRLNLFRLQASGSSTTSVPTSSTTSVPTSSATTAPTSSSAPMAVPIGAGIANNRPLRRRLL